MLGEFLCSEAHCGKGINKLKSISKQTKKKGAQNKVIATCEHFLGLQLTSLMLHSDFKALLFLIVAHGALPVKTIQTNKTQVKQAKPNKKLQLLLWFRLHFKLGKPVQVLITPEQK